MAKRIIGTTPKQDGYRMPAEFEPQQGVWMLWPERNGRGVFASSRRSFKNAGNTGR